MRFDLMTLFRAAAWCRQRGMRRAARLLWGLQLPLFGSSVPPEVVIGSDTKFGYRGAGIVIHDRAVIGSECVISHQVTIGGRSGLYGVPVLHDRVEVGAGAKVLGPITIGTGAKIGANAVVINDVPAGWTAVGVPAKCRAPSAPSVAPETGP